MSGPPEKQPAVYILASNRDGALYVGVTSDLRWRVLRHKQGLIEGYTKQHGIKLLVYYEMHLTMPDAIAREGRLKKWHRTWKVRLIHAFNPEWRDLFIEETGVLLDGPADIQRERP